MVLESALSAVRRDLWRIVIGLRDQRRPHRRSHADLGLAAAFGSRKRRVVFAEIADQGARQQAPTCPMCSTPTLHPTCAPTSPRLTQIKAAELGGAALTTVVTAVLGTAVWALPHS